MAKDTINRDKVNSFIPEKVAAKAINVVTSYMNLGKTVYRDFEDEVKSEGDTVRLPKFGSMDANEMSKTGVVTLQNPDDDEVSVTLDQHWETSFLIRDVARAMAKPKVLEGYVKAGSIALAEKIENALASLYALAGDTVNAGSSPSKEHIRAARKKLVDAKVPRVAPRYAYLDTDFYDSILSDTTIVDASAYGDRSALLEGKVRRLYGADIFETQNVVTSGSPATYHSLMYTEEAMGLAMRPMPQVNAEMGGQLGVMQTVVQDPESGIGMRVSYSWDKDHLGVQVTLDVLFGVGVLRPEWLIDIYHT